MAKKNFGKLLALATITGAVAAGGLIDIGVAGGVIAGVPAVVLAAAGHQGQHQGEGEQERQDLLHGIFLTFWFWWAEQPPAVRVPMPALNRIFGTKSTPI